MTFHTSQTAKVQRTGFSPLFLFPLAVFTSLFFAFTSPASSQEHSLVEIARPGRATPWVNKYATEMQSVVPLSSIPMLEGLPFKTKFYEIDSDVLERGYFYLYFVRGNRNDYVVESTVQLYRLLSELRALEKLLDYDPAGDHLTGMRQELKKIGKMNHDIPNQFKAAARKNDGTTKANATKKPGMGYGLLYKRVPPVGLSEKGEDRGALGSGPLGDECRKIAYAYGLDVYTDNPEVREALKSIADKRMAVPGAKVLSPFNFFGKVTRNEKLETYIRDNGPESIRIIAGAELSKTFGVPWADAENPLGKFMLNPNYTPRQILYLAKCLQDMASVEGIDLAVASLGMVDSPELADYAYVYLRLYHALHSKVIKLAKFIELENTGAAIGNNGVFYFLFPGDVLSEWSLAPEEIDQILNEATLHGASKIKVVALGIVKPEVMKYLRDRKVDVIQNLLKDPRFFEEEY